MRRVLFYFFFLFFSSCYAGFYPDTVIFVSQKSLPIDRLQKDCCVISYDPAKNTIIQSAVTNLKAYTSSCACKVICDDDISFVASPNQRVMTVSRRSGKTTKTDNGEWRFVKDLKKGDRLWCYNCQYIFVQDVQIISQETELVEITVLPSHTFFITSARILVHNHPAIMITAAPLVTSIIPAAAKAVGVLGIVGTALYSLFAKRDRHKIEKSSIGSSSNCSTPPLPPEDEKERKRREEEEFRKKHPHGRYEDVGYHHKNSSGKKSPQPKDGQAALDDSHLIEGQNRHRISVNNQEIVVLYETGPGRYHGHVRIWGDLTNGMRNTLIRRGLTSIKGKFLK